jgi:hypothetical protein
MIPNLLKRDKPTKVANNFKSWSTTRDIHQSGAEAARYTQRSKSAVQQPHARLGTVITLTRSPFSERQQISKGEYKRTQQPTFTRGMGKSDIMHGICGAHDICRNINILCRVVLKNILYFCKAHPLQKEQEVFQYYNKIPWTKPSRYLSSFPLVFLFKNSSWTSRPP